MRLSRPPFILAHPGDNAGCGFHRIYRPMELMIRNGVCFGTPTVAFIPKEQAAILAPDIIVFQRQNEPHQVEAIKQYREALPNAFFVYELDDALSAVPEKSWHRPFMPVDVDERTKVAVSLCDAMTVTTHDLARHMRNICGNDLDVRVVPNMLGRDDIMNTRQIRSQATRTANRKFRIGWGGGIGHPGDLAILNSAFEELKDDVEWVFLGMLPEVPAGVKATFAGAYPPQQYLQALASIDVDLVVAPLEDNLFNRCKSNLRIIEAGACNYPVIASPVTPYLENSPPIEYAKDDEWTAKIREFMALEAIKRNWAGERLSRWVERHYILDDKAAQRLEGWLPKGKKAFEPKLAPNAPSKIIVVGSADELGSKYATARSLSDALNSVSNGDIIYVRPGTRVTSDMLDRFTSKLDMETATVSAVGNDSGIASFPKQSMFAPMDRVIADKLDTFCAEDMRTLTIPTACGPIMLLKRNALNVLGFPDLGAVNEDIAIIEWSAMASFRGFKNVLNTGLFVRVDTPLSLPQDKVTEIAQRILMRWQQKPMDVEGFAETRERLELRYHKEVFKYLAPENPGDYDRWLEMINILGPTELRNAEAWRKNQSADINVIEYDPYSEWKSRFWDYEREWTLFHVSGSKLEPHAVAVFTDAIQNNPDALVLYCDHDYIGPEPNTGVVKRQGHDFKPNFDLHLFLGRDYITPCFAIKTVALRGLDENLTGAAFYELVLATVYAATRDSVQHIPHLLATLPLPNIAQLNEVTEKKRVCAQAFATFMKWPAAIEHHPIGMGLMNIKYSGVPGYVRPRVAIIIPTKNKTDMLGPCLSTLKKFTAYDNFEVLIVSNNTTNPAMHDMLAEAVKDPRFKVVSWDHEYNWSQLNNMAVKQVEADFYLFLNDDTRITGADWLDEMVCAALIDDVGTVGAKLVYPSGAIQHIGVVCDIGVNGHTHKGIPVQSPGYQGIAAVSHEVTCSTGACLLVPRRIFEEVGGFDEDLGRNFNDVLFGIRVRELGYINVLANRAELQHFEGVTRNENDPTHGMDAILRDGKIFQTKTQTRDPYWNWNLRFFDIGDGIRVAGLNCDVLNWTRKTWPWSETSTFERVLVIGPVEAAADERRDGCAIYEMQAVGYHARISNPVLENLRPFDLRNPNKAKAALNTLGITRIVLSVMKDLPLNLLGFFSRLDIPIIYRPFNAESGCPQGDMKREGVPCHEGYKHGECQGCVDKFNSPHGHVNVIAWKIQWTVFFMDRNVEIDLSYLSKEHEFAFRDFFENLKVAA